MDDKIKPIIKSMTRKGFKPIASCAGHLEEEDFQVYIMLEYDEVIEEKIHKLNYFDKIISKQGVFIDEDTILFTYVKKGNFEKTDFEKTQILLLRELERFIKEEL